MNQCPETCVVEIIDVAIGLTPAQVVSEILIGRIEDDAAVKGGRILEGRVWEEGGPMKYIGRGEVRYQSCSDLAIQNVYGGGMYMFRAKCKV